MATFGFSLVGLVPSLVREVASLTAGASASALHFSLRQPHGERYAQ